MTKIGIYGRSSLIKHKEYIQYLCSLLESKKIPFCLSKQLVAIADCACTDSFSNHEEFIQCKADLLISLGGDGTILDTLTLVKNSGIPVLGINLGRLGFLANTSKEETEKSIYSLERNSYQIEKRMLLELNSNFPLFKDENYALNEMTIQRSNSSSMIIVNAYMNGELLNQYFTDGLIISTPTGSTGYNLSCGGPIIHPQSNNFIITPIAPHNLNVRPIVLSDDVTLTFEVSGRTKDFLCTLDSRAASITGEYELAVKKANFSMNLVKLHDNTFLDALKAKLMWGLDQRG